MASCEYCGNGLAEDATVCPNCGALRSAEPVEHTSNAPGTGTHDTQPNIVFTPGFEAFIPEPRPLSDRRYTPYAASNQDDSQANREGQQPSSTASAPSSAAAQSPPFQANEASRRPSSRFSTFSMRILNTIVTGPEILEALLSLFLGIYGVGWLLAGEIPAGILLLIGSVVLYLPLVVVSFVLAIATVGLSLLCTGPLAIGAICLNLFLLHNRMKRKQRVLHNGGF